MKKALIIAYNDLNNSGVPNVIYQSVKALHEEYSFDVLVFGDDDYYYQKLKEEGIIIRLIKYIDKKPKGKISRLLWWLYKRPHNHYLFMMDLLKENDYDVIHSFKEYDSWPLFKAAKRKKIKKRIFHCNVNLNIHKKSKSGLLVKRNTRLSIKYSTALIGVSDLSCKSAFKNNRYKILYNSYNNKKFNLDVKNNLSSDDLVITHVASFNENKNQLFSLRVLYELKKFYKNVRLNLVGATDMNDYYKKLIDYTEENNLKSEVIFVERTNRVDEIYENTTFAILPSNSEGLPLTVIEAQACGITVFASTNVTNEVNCGGVKFLDLSKGPEYWAHEMYNMFLSIKNERSKYNLDKFSFDRFKKELELIYNCK